MVVGLEDNEKGPQNCRKSIKARDSFNNYSSWKHKLRENCFKRVREDRTRLIWKLRVPAAEDQSSVHQDSMTSTLQGIISDELRKMKSCESSGYPTMDTPTDEMIWEYDGLHTAYQGDCEEIVLEMQRIFYEDCRMAETSKDSNSCIRIPDDEEDEFLARALEDHMQLNSQEGKEVVWCPICIHGVLKETSHHIFCSQCRLRLQRDDEVNLSFLQQRLAEAHEGHQDSGCGLKPKFCTETKFEMTALYITCPSCNTFEVVF